jgi:hypothetical protein
MVGAAIGALVTEASQQVAEQILAFAAFGIALG